MIRFGLFELDTRSGELRKLGIRLRLGDQAGSILRALLNSPGEIVTREQLKEAVWPDRAFLDFDSAINKSVSQIRTILGDEGANPRFIETVSKRGYRFIAPVTGGASGEAQGTCSLAVLPFENLTGDPSLAYLADGVTELLTNGLSGLKKVRVISRTSAKACAAVGKPLTAIGKDLRVNTVVEGSLMRFAQLRLNVRLVDIHSDRVLWQANYDCEPENLLALCEQLNGAIAAEITGSPVSPPVSERLSRVPPAAHLSYLKGRYFWSKRTEADLYRSIEEFQKVLTAHPDFALAHAGLADAYALVGIWALEPAHTAFRIARQAAERAIELDDGLAEAHACLGEVLKDYDWNWSAAESEFRRAIALNANCTSAHHSYAQLLTSLKRFKEAAEEIELARRIDPLSPAINAFVPYIYLAARDYERALEEGKRAVELEPNSAIARWQFGRACLFAGDASRAVAELETASCLANRRPLWQAELSFARAKAGDLSGAEAILNELIALAQHTHVSPYDLALCYAGMGNISAALDQLETGYAERVMRMVGIGDPELDHLRPEPRFMALVERLRLPA